MLQILERLKRWLSWEFFTLETRTNPPVSCTVWETDELREAANEIKGIRSIPIEGPEDWISTEEMWLDDIAEVADWLLKPESGFFDVDEVEAKDVTSKDTSFLIRTRAGNGFITTALEETEDGYITNQGWVSKQYWELVDG